MAADRGQRRLQLVADGQQERALRILGAVQLLGELVERRRELAQLGRALDGQRLGALALRQPAARLGDARYRLRDRPREQEGDDRGEHRADGGGDREPHEEGVPVVRLVARGAEQDDGIAASEPGRIDERLAAHLDGAVGTARSSQLLGAAVGEEQLGLGRREDREALLLGREEAAEGRLSAWERVRRVLGDDQVDLAVERPCARRDRATAA